MRFALFIVLIYSSLSAYSVANGKSLFLSFDKKENIQYKEIKLDKKTFKVYKNPKDDTKYYALVPISYYQKPTRKNLELRFTNNGVLKTKNIDLVVKDGMYKKEEIHVSASKVNPRGKEVKKRISLEYNEAMKIYNTVTPLSYLTSEFILPIESLITSDFGKARVYNGSLKGYHSGTDFRAKVGTPIIAANDAKVVLVKDRFYSGGTVLLDHGYGIYTCYFHMSKFDVKRGDVITKGTLLGLSGQSGRVTGPHLHFSARINGVQVDPLQLITLLNNNILKGN